MPRPPLRVFRTLALSSTLFIPTMVAGPASAELDFTGADFSVLPVAGPVHVLRTESNVANTSVAASIGEDGILLIDDSFGPLSEILAAKVDSLGGGGVQFVVNTHFHWDHTEGNEAFGQDATIVAHDWTREALRTKTMPATDRVMLPHGWPVLTTHESLSLHFNGEEIQIVAMRHPGHTGGDLVAHFTASDVICVGDYYFVDRWPIVDLGNGGSIDGYVQNLERILSMGTDATKVIPGHGHFGPEPIRLHTLGEMKTWAALLKDSIGVIRSELKGGTSVEALQEKGLPERFAPFDAKPRFVSTTRWIQTVADDS